MADLLIHQTFYRQRLEKSRFNKLSPHQTFPLYGMYSMYLDRSQVNPTYLCDIDFITLSLGSALASSNESNITPVPDLAIPLSTVHTLTVLYEK